MPLALSRFLVSFAFDLGRYVVVATPVYVVFWVWLGERLRSRWLRPAPPRSADTRREVLHSFVSAVVFSLTGVLVLVGADHGILRLYTDPLRHGLAYLVLSPLAVIVAQDAYFYFTHRAMHHRWLFRAVHAVHHRSRHTSPWTAYAFSPAEALVHAAFVPLVLLVVPLHPIALFVVLGYMIVRNVFGHLGIELLPAGFTSNRLGRWHTTTTHHALHHTRPGSHYGLYFTWWDRWLGTEDARYEAEFQGATGSGRLAS